MAVIKLINVQHLSRWLQIRLNGREKNCTVTHCSGGKCKNMYPFIIEVPAGYSDLISLQQWSHRLCFQVHANTCGCEKHYKYVQWTFFKLPQQSHETWFGRNLIYIYYEIPIGMFFYFILTNHIDQWMVSLWKHFRKTSHKSSSIWLRPMIHFTNHNPYDLKILLKCWCHC